MIVKKQYLSHCKGQHYIKNNEFHIVYEYVVTQVYPNNLYKSKKI